MKGMSLMEDLFLKEESAERRYRKALRTVLAILSVVFLGLQLVFNPIAFSFFMNQGMGIMAFLLGGICLVSSFKGDIETPILKMPGIGRELIPFFSAIFWGFVPTLAYATSLLEQAVSY